MNQKESEFEPDNENDENWNLNMIMKLWIVNNLSFLLNRNIMLCFSYVIIVKIM